MSGGWRKGQGVRQQCRQGELLHGVHRALRADWRHIYRRTTVDGHGFLQLLFEPLPEQRRGELRSYLNRFLEHNACCAEFGLVRDPSRWGVPHATAEGAPLLLFAVRPPWVPNEPLAGERQRVAAAAAAARASRSRPEGEHEHLSAPA